MPITNTDIQIALRIRRCVAEYFELMPLLIKTGIFNANHKDGLPIRDFLRKLDSMNHLSLIPEAHFEQKAINKNWYFIKTVDK
jgi:hypothetical protein